MEQENSKKKRKKSTVIHHNQEESIIVEDEQRKLYNAASAGNHRDLSQLIKHLEQKISPSELEEIAFNVYTKLKLNNISVKVEVELLLYEYFWVRCLFCKSSHKINDIKSRIQTIASIVNFIEVCDHEELIICLKFIVKEIHLLKHLLASTYDLLPWEEIEFYIYCFVVMSTERHELNVFYRSFLNKTEIIGFLQDFVKSLKHIQIDKKEDLSKLPELTRNEAVQKITATNPNFQKLFESVVYIRDVYCLHKISKYAEFAESISPQEIKGHEFIIRIMSVISEQMKYTLCSPKLSPIKSDYILFSFSENSRKFITDLSNAISIEEAFIYRQKLLKQGGENVFERIREDLVCAGKMAEALIFRHFIPLLTQRFENIENSSTLLEEIENSALIFQYAEEKFNRYRVRSERLIEVINQILSMLPKNDHRTAQLRKIIDKKPPQRSLLHQHFEWKGIWNYILKTEVRNNLIDYFKPSVCSREDVVLLLDIALSMQKDWLDNVEMGRLNTEMINLLSVETDIDLSLSDKIQEISNINRKKFTSEYIEENNQDEMKFSEPSLISDFKINKTRTPYSKLNPKSLELMKSLALDIMSSSYIQSNQEKIKKNGMYISMVLEFLRNDYELSDLFFNSNMISFYLANNHEQFLKQNNENEQTRMKHFFSDQIMFVLKRLKTFSMIANGQFEKFVGLKENDFKARNSEKSTFLHIAAKKSDEIQIEYLREAGLGHLYKNLKDQTPLHIAAQNGNEKAVCYFINMQNRILDYSDHLGRTALHMSVLKKHKKIVGILVEANSDLFKKDHLSFSPFLYALLDKNKDIFEILLANAVNIDEIKKTELQTLLQIAIDKNQVEMVESLVSKTPTILDEKIRDTVMLSAVSNGQIGIIEILINHGVRPRNFILIAVMKGFDLIVEKLLETKADEVNCTNPGDMMTPLHYAAMSGNDHIVDLLLRHNANVESVNSDRDTPLHLAVQHGHFHVAKMIVEKVKDHKVISMMNSRRHTPLHIAAEIGEYDMVQLLIEYWADIESRDFSITPLQLAKQNGHDRIVKLLISNGASYSKPLNSVMLDTNIPNKKVNKKSIVLTERMVQNPSIIIHGADSDNLRTNNNEIINKIIEQNNLEKNARNKLEIIHKYPKGKTCSIIVVLEKSLYEQIMTVKVLNIDFEHCAVSDYFFIYRCHQCAGFGHDIVDCDNEHVCSKCSGNHFIASCESEEFKCFHCLDKNQSLGLKLDIKHSPFDQFCHWYRQLLKEKYKKQINSANRSIR